MKQTHYITTTIQDGNRLEIPTPTIAVGETVEVILIFSEKPSNFSSSPDSRRQADTVFDRRTFMKLPLAERQVILAQQAEAMVEHYEQDTEWRDWLSFEVDDPNLEESTT